MEPTTTITPGEFIVLDGIDGTGKSTQLLKLRSFLADRGISVITTRDPGGCPSAESIRDLLVRGDGDKFGAITELLLFAAARCELLGRVIKPALARGTWVLCDRYISSTYAYQGYGRRGDIDAIRNIIDSTVDVYPDLTILLDITTEESYRRTTKQSDIERRFESIGDEFMERVRAGFLTLPSTGLLKSTSAFIDASRSIDEVANDIFTTVAGYCLPR